MSKNILVVSTSLRADSNSDLLAEAFMNGAGEAGHEVETVSLKRGCRTKQNIFKI